MVSALPVLCGTKASADRVTGILGTRAAQGRTVRVGFGVIESVGAFNLVERKQELLDAMAAHKASVEYPLRTTGVPYSTLLGGAEGQRGLASVIPRSAAACSRPNESVRPPRGGCH